MDDIIYRYTASLILSPSHRVSGPLVESRQSTFGELYVTARVIQKSMKEYSFHKPSTKKYALLQNKRIKMFVLCSPTDRVQDLKFATSQLSKLSITVASLDPFIGEGAIFVHYCIHIIYIYMYIRTH